MRHRRVVGRAGRHSGCLLLVLALPLAIIAGLLGPFVRRSRQ